MIAPCMCTGSVRYVHAACLQRWRTTSQTAATTCPKCLAHYTVRRRGLLGRALLHVAFYVLQALQIVIVAVFGYPTAVMLRVGMAAARAVLWQWDVPRARYVLSATSALDVASCLAILAVFVALLIAHGLVDIWRRQPETLLPFKLVAQRRYAGVYVAVESTRRV
jgi:hypothetical protein